MSVSVAAFDALLSIPPGAPLTTWRQTLRCHGITSGRQLVWYDHEGWLTSPIHVDFTDYQSIL